MALSVRKSIGFRPAKGQFCPKSPFNVPKSLLDRLAGFALALPVDQIWSVKMVGDELVDAVRLCNRVGGSVLPSDRMGYWPATLTEWADLMAMVETNEKPSSSDAPRRMNATARQVTRMERAIIWPARYLPGRNEERSRRILAIWLRARASRGASFGEALKRRGIARSTAYRTRDRALLIIALGLMSDGERP